MVRSSCVRSRAAGDRGFAVEGEQAAREGGRNARRDPVAGGIAAGESIGGCDAGLFFGWNDGRADHGVVAYPQAAGDFAYVGDAIQADAEIARRYRAGFE